MTRSLWVAVAVLFLGLVMLVSGLAGGPFSHLVLPVVVIALGLLLAAVGWRRRPPAADVS